MNPTSVNPSSSPSHSRSNSISSPSSLSVTTQISAENIQAMVNQIHILTQQVQQLQSVPVSTSSSSSSGSAPPCGC